MHLIGGSVVRVKRWRKRICIGLVAMLASLILFCAVALPAVMEGSSKLESISKDVNEIKTALSGDSIVKPFEDRLDAISERLEKAEKEALKIKERLNK